MCLSSGCGGGSGGDSPRLLVSLTSSQTKYQRGERILFTLSLTNGSSQPLSYSLSGGKGPGIEVRPEGSATVVFGDELVCATEGCSSIAPVESGKSTSIEVRWGQEDFTAGLCNGSPCKVVPGRYVVSARVTQVTGASETVIPSNRVTIEIQP